MDCIAIVLCSTLFLGVYIVAEGTTTTEYYGYDDQTQLDANKSKTSDNTLVIGSVVGIAVLVIIIIVVILMIKKKNQKGRNPNEKQNGSVLQMQQAPGQEVGNKIDDNIDGTTASPKEEGQDESIIEHVNGIDMDTAGDVIEKNKSYDDSSLDNIQNDDNASRL